MGLKQELERLGRGVGEGKCWVWGTLALTGGLEEGLQDKSEESGITIGRGLLWKKKKKRSWAGLERPSGVGAEIGKLSASGAGGNLAVGRAF